MNRVSARSCTASNIPYAAQTAQAYSLQKVVSTCLLSGLRLGFGSLAQFWGSGPQCALVSHSEHFEQYKLL